MVRSSLTIQLLFIFCSAAMAQTTIQLQIKSLPVYHPSGSDIYAAGSFNGWNPQDEHFKFQQDKDGKYCLVLRLKKGSYEYKMTRGDWDKVECKKGGDGMANRTLNVDDGENKEVVIEEWADRFPAIPKSSTASKNVKVIDTAFLIPQLKRTRRVWIYLPETYEAGTERFPVIYMQDGQNIFDEATSFGGEWGVDEYLDSLGMDSKKFIVVAIDNGGAKRLNEYCPYNFKLTDTAGSPKSNEGEGNAYADFLVKTLKPHIDKKYRTDKSKEGTFVAGSSMGGLISLYTVLKFPAVFGAAAIFSASLWVAPKIFDDIKKKGKKVSSKLYFYAGKLESESMVSDTRKAFEEMKKVSKSKMELVIRDGGEHNEASWKREFPLFYEWLASK